MTYTRRVFSTYDLDTIAPLLQPMQAHMAALFDNPLLRNTYYTPPYCWSLMRGDDLVACTGIIPKRDAGYAWALLAGDIMPSGMVALHRLAGWLLTVYTSTRQQKVRTLVAEGFKQGERWVEMLGMVPVGTMEKPDGVFDHTIYERAA